MANDSAVETFILGRWEAHARELYPPKPIPSIISKLVGQHVSLKTP
jgi:hypothetical protein